jgi:hypothetical protein
MNFGIIDSWLWETNRWDGPISGSALIQGKRYYLQMIDEDEVRNRAFAVYDPPEWFWSILDLDQKLFEKYVGLYTTYVNGKRLTGEVKPTYKYYFNYLRIEHNVKEEWRVGTVFEFIHGP